MGIHWLFALAGASAILAAGGCARTAEERQLDSMRAEIDRTEDRDPAALTAAADEPAPVRPAPAGRPAAPAGVAAAPVVRLGDDPADGDPADYADPDDSAPRPRIRVLGSPRVKGRDVEEVDDAAGPGAGGERLDPDAKRAYDEALALVNSHQCDRALDALASFLVKWPDHPYADHAMYWRGECYFARGEYAKAADQLEGVLARFPAGSKVPDALWLTGKAYEKLGQPEKARAAIDRLRREHPQSDAARRSAAPIDSRPP